MRILEGDCREQLKTLADNSIDAVVTDPPYHLTSIVKRFGGTNAAPAKSDGATGVYARSSVGFMGQQWDGGDVAFDPELWAEVLRVLKPGGHVLAFSGSRTYHRMAVAIEDAGFEIRDQIMWVYGSGFPKSHDTAQSIEKLLTTGKARRPDRDLGGLPRNRFSGSEEGGLIANTGGKVDLTTPEAQAFEGWGTALKPAHEPICLARKPLSEKNIAANVLEHGTGAINIDGCRVHALGRWPANIIHDGSDEVLAGFPSETGVSSGARVAASKLFGVAAQPEVDTDSGSAARFFYCAKANKKERRGSAHPTVKPIALMRYLCRLITPPGGTVLDPFAGTGTTGEAAMREGFVPVLIERETAYLQDIHHRLAETHKEMHPGAK